MAITQSFIDGESVASAEVYDNIDPATGASLGAVARAGGDEIDRAVTAARSASKPWRDTSPAERSALLGRIADLVDEDRERLARIECEDTGKPLSQVEAEAPPDEETAALWAAEYESRMGAHEAALAAAAAPAEAEAAEETSNPRDWSPSEL